MPKKNSDYLLQRKGRGSWYFHVNVPPYMREHDATLPKKIVHSTGTDDRLQAQIISAPWLAEWRRHVSFYKAFKTPPVLAKLRGTDVIDLRYNTPLGKTEHSDGTITISSKDSVVTYADNSFTVELRRAPNYPLGIDQTVLFPHIDGGPMLRMTRDYVNPQGHFTIEPTEIVRDVDMEVVDNWANTPSTKGKAIDPRFVSDAKQALKLFKTIRPGITFASADYDDGVALSNLLAALPNKSGTVRKKIAFLRRAVVLAKRSPKRFPELKGVDNPFSGVVTMLEDAQEKVMLDDGDMELIRARIHELGSNERKLLIWCLATGCRRGEPFEIKGEKVIDGFRTIHFGTKTEASKRTLPLPPALLELHPEPIIEPLFSDSEVNVGKRINKWFRKIGITDPSKTLHSTRHRASYKLRSFKDSLRWECLGHEKRTDPSETYGVYPQKEMFDALSAIGI